MKTALLTALAVPLFVATPVVAHADPGGPPAIFTPQQECDATRAVVNLERKQNPNATPQQIADAYVRRLDQQGAYKNLPADRKDGDRQYILNHITSCHL